MSDVKLGTIIADPASAARDAIHIAVAPVWSDETLFPGQPVALCEGSTEKVQSLAPNPIGIVDPFLKHPAMAGKRFWLLLMPQTITGLRHEWTHPAFQSKPTGADARAKSSAWLASFCAEHNVPFDDLIEGVKEFVQSSEKWAPRYVQVGSESLRDGGAATPEFWAHFTAYTGLTVPPEKIGANPFCCTC